jgi:hypothetical protein
MRIMESTGPPVYGVHRAVGGIMPHCAPNSQTRARRHGSWPGGRRASPAATYCRPVLTGPRLPGRAKLPSSATAPAGVPQPNQ